MNRNPDTMEVLGWLLALVCVLAAIAFVVEHLAIIVAVLLIVVGFTLGVYLVWQAIGSRSR